MAKKNLYERRSLFEFMLDRVREVGTEFVIKEEQAFVRWFISLYFEHTTDVAIPDGPGDGKIDGFFKRIDDEEVEHWLVNSKFTGKYDQIAPPAFYSEIVSFWRA